ncbi:LacI family DNA-binding transcriptional regulator [Pontiellaceae bacterium B1224]|nr:LacI family DNA-binding transcriptional regulator [Pontiellaceae bacterium B1224]
MSEANTHKQQKYRVTQTDIANALGISKMTVSLALRKDSRVAEQTRLRVEEKATALGYVPDPELTALHRYRHNSRIKNIQATLAWLNTWPDPKQLRQFREFNLYWDGAYDHAQQLGYRLEEFDTAEIPMERLRTIFRTRNIQGILLPPQYHTAEELLQFDWSDFAVVRFGQSIPDLKTHFVSSAQMMNTILAFKHMQKLGYQRIGFVRGFHGLRHFTAGYLWAQNNLPAKQQLPLFKMRQPDDIEFTQERLEAWLNQNKPDAVLTDIGKMPSFLKELGYRIPEDIGVATTSIHDTPIDAGIDQRPYNIGRAAIRLLSALITEKAFGIPAYCDETLIEGRWVDGSMLPRHK